MVKVLKGRSREEAVAIVKSRVDNSAGDGVGCGFCEVGAYMS